MPHPAIIVSNSLHKELKALSGKSTYEAIEEAREQELWLAHTWISRNPNKYEYGLIYGFHAHTGTDDSVQRFKELVLPELNDSPYSYTLNQLCKGNGYQKKSEIVDLLTVKYKYSKSKSRKIFNKVIRDLRQSGCEIGVLKSNWYALKSVPEDVTKDPKGERIMSKSKKSKSKKRSKATKNAPKKKVEKKPAKAKVEEKKPAKAKKEAKKTIRTAVEELLRDGGRTKRELVKFIVESGMSKVSTDENALKYINLMFYKMRKSGRKLECKHEPKEGGGIRGRFSLVD